MSDLTLDKYSVFFSNCFLRLAICKKLDVDIVPWTVDGHFFHLRHSRKFVFYFNSQFCASDLDLLMHKFIILSTNNHLSLERENELNFILTKLGLKPICNNSNSQTFARQWNDILKSTFNLKFRFFFFVFYHPLRF